MSSDKKLESYLNVLEKSLSQIPISDRAEIILEIKSHVMAAQEKHPEMTVNAILESLGDPEAVANRYILERGLKVGKPPKTPMVKWLTIGFLGTISIFTFFILILIWKFTPIISVDEEKDKVVILGGMINLNGKHGSIKLGLDSFGFDQEFNTNIEGSKPIDKGLQQASILFNNGIFNVSTDAKLKEIRWRCSGKNSENQPKLEEKNGALQINFQEFDVMKCKVKLPAGIRSSIQGKNGQLEVIKPLSSTDIQMVNGHIKIAPAPEAQYKYKIHVTHGYVDSFQSSESKNALEIKIDLTNGYIKNQK